MLGDRDYMRQMYGAGRPSAVITLLAANLGVFLLQSFFIPTGFFLNYLALSLDGLRHGFLWQLFTYQFFHGGWLHLLVNCWVLYVFGPEVEATLGRKRFLFLYFVSGVVGGIFQAFVSFLWPNYFGGAVVGASAGVFGVVSAFAMFYPARQLTLLLFFVVPIRLRARSLLLINLVITALGISYPNSFLGAGIAHAAHLGGILAGLALSRRKY